MTNPPEVPELVVDVGDVVALVPEADLDRLERVGLGSTRIAVWVDELTARVMLRCRGWGALTGSDLAAFSAFAGTVVANGAASYLEAARHPERAAVSDTSYAAVLWARYTEGLDELVAWVAAAKTDTLDGALDDTATLTAHRPAAAFPPPVFRDGIRW